MSNSKLHLFCFLFFFIFSFAYSSSFNTTHKCSPKQTRALLTFKQSLFSINDTSKHHWRCQDWLGPDYHPIMMNWKVSTDCCNWDGVTCSHFTHDVIGLDLSCGMLQGTIDPNTTLFNLPRLQRLNLAFNDFTRSQFPSEIGMLSNSLTHLNISGCWFFGQVPTDITVLRKLVSLDLSRNYNLDLEAHVFNTMLRNFTVLEELSLDSVGIYSVLPTYLNITSSLKLLDLGSTGLQGKLPHNIFNLQSLEILDLSGNSFTGHISSDLSLPKLVSLDLAGGLNDLQMQPHVLNNLLQNSTHLRYLSLVGVNIGLVLPTYLNLSSSLKSLDLALTSLRGKLPDNIFNLQYLEELHLSYNLITGILPKVNTSNNIPLKELILTYTDLTGSLPKSLVNLRQLYYLALSNNMLNGTLPSELFSLSSLEYMLLNHNMFSGNIPFESVSLPSLMALDLSYNNFRGNLELETFLSSLASLTSLGLSYSGLSVTTKNVNSYVNPDFDLLELASCKLRLFPESLRAMKNLEWLNLSRNEIHGHIPDWAGEINYLYLLDLSYNFITCLPQFQWNYLQVLNLRSNQIEGPIYPSIWNMSKLRYLDMSNNSFDGVIPQCFENLTSLKMINLGNNRLQGTIPNVYENYGELSGLILNGNELEGEVPRSLSKCKSLEVLDLGNNHLNGTFPICLEILPNLHALVLKSNNFHGPIVASSAVEFSFPSLRVLDLSNNGFEGKLPAKYFQNFNAMKNVGKKSTKPEYLPIGIGGWYYSITVAVKGVEQEFPQILVDYTILDLSNNSFEGEILNVIGGLTSLIVLNLSHNNLTGRIPHALGKLSEIESLDLSWNQLTGEIPQSLSDLTFLEFLNLSQNHLVGRIPKGKQIDTFEWNSFGGNPNLCGLQLAKKCSEHPHELQLEGDEDEDEDESGFMWRSVMLGFSCGTLLGLVMGYLMLSIGRPKWFNEFADETMPKKKRRFVYIGN